MGRFAWRLRGAAEVIPPVGNGLAPGAAFDGTMLSGWEGAEPETTMRAAGDPRCAIVAFEPNWLTVLEGDRIGFVARSKGTAKAGIEKVVAQMEGGPLVENTVPENHTWTDARGVEHTDKVHWFDIDVPAILALGFTRPACAVRATAYSNDEDIGVRVSERKIVYPRATAFGRERKVSLTPGYTHTTLGGADFNTLVAAMNDARTAHPTRTRLWLLEDGEYSYDQLSSPWDTAEEWLVIKAAPGVNATIGGGKVGGVPSRVNCDAIWFEGNEDFPLGVDIGRLGYTGATAMTTRSVSTSSMGRYAFAGCDLICSTMGGPDVGGVTYTGSGTGKYALVNGRQISPNFISADVDAGDLGKLNVYFMECTASEDGMPAGAFNRYKLVRHCHIPDVSGSAFESQLDHALTWKSTSGGAGGYTAGLRANNPAFSITAGTTGHQMTAVGSNGGVTRIDLKECGVVVYTYTVRITTTNRAWKVSDFVAWVNDSKPGWAATADDPDCPLSIEFLSRPGIDPATAFGTVTFSAGVPIVCTCKMDIHANLYVTTRPQRTDTNDIIPGSATVPAGVQNVIIHGGGGGTLGAAPFSIGAGKRFDYFMENLGIYDRGETYVDPYTDTPAPIGAQEGYAKDIQDEHCVMRCMTVSHAAWFYGDGYESLGHNVVDRVVAFGISKNTGGALTGPGVGRVHRNCVSIAQNDAWFTTLGGTNCKGYGTGIPDQATIEIDDVFDDAAVGELTPITYGSTAGARLPDGTYAGWLNELGEEQFETYFD